MFSKTPPDMSLFNNLSEEQKNHMLKYHLGSIFIDCPICGEIGPGNRRSVYERNQPE